MQEEKTVEPAKPVDEVELVARGRGLGRNAVINNRTVKRSKASKIY